MAGVLKMNFVVYLSTDEKETQSAFRKHFDHQLELYKTVVSIQKCLMVQCTHNKNGYLRSNAIWSNKV